MEREEAIKWLIKPTVTSTEVSPTKAKELEAYYMAIEALQWQDRILTQIEDIVQKEHGERREERAEQTEYKLPFEDEIMEALDKLTLKGGDSND